MNLFLSHEKKSIPINFLKGNKRRFAMQVGEALCKGFKRENEKKTKEAENC